MVMWQHQVAFYGLGHDQTSPGANQEKSDMNATSHRLTAMGFHHRSG
jgi:hypothetical protein